MPVILKAQLHCCLTWNNSLCYCRPCFGKEPQHILVHEWVLLPIYSLPHPLSLITNGLTQKKTPVAVGILAVSWNKPPRVPFLNTIQLSLSGLNGEVSDATGCPSEGKVLNEDQGNPALTFRRARSQYLGKHFHIFLRARTSGTGQNWVKLLRKTFLHWAANLHLFCNSNCTPRSSPKACEIRTTAQQSPDDTVQK